MKPMGSGLRVLVPAVLAFSLGACGGYGRTPASQAPPRLQGILESGELRVGVSADLPPLNMKNKRGEIIGFEIDLVRALAEAMDLEANFVERPFASYLKLPGM